MKPVLLTLLLNALIVFLILVLIQRKQALNRPGLLALFFGIYFLDNLAITLTNHYPQLQIFPNAVWEGFLVTGWSGKLFSIVLVSALFFMARTGIPKEEVGLRLRQNKGSMLPASLVILALAAWATIIGMNSPKGDPDLKVLAYLALMPGLNEELVYRGYLLAITNALLPSKFRLFGAQVGWGFFITSLLFGLLHGVWLDSSLAVHLDIIALQNTTISGLIFAWLKERTGSLVLPIAAHGIEDFLFFLPRMV